MSSPDRPIDPRDLDPIGAPRIDRRRALAEIAAATSTVLWLAGCGPRLTARKPSDSGSTLDSIYADPDGNGALSVEPGVPLIDRTDLAPKAALGTRLATLAHLTDAHVLDAESPARVPFLDRLGKPFASTFRPHETLTTHVLAAAVRSVNALKPDAVLQGGDLIDNVQRNELDNAIAVLSGGKVTPGSGGANYSGVQSAANPDPFYYRPDVDAPRHPGLLAQAMRAYTGPGLAAPWYPVAGDHDLLVQGILTPTDTTRRVALSGRAVRELPTGLDLPRGLSTASGSSPDGVADPALLNGLIDQALAKSKGVAVKADPARRELDPAEVLASLRDGSALSKGENGAAKPSGSNGPETKGLVPASGALTAGPTSTDGVDYLDYAFNIGDHVRVIVLDLARRGGGSGGLAHPGQAAWLTAQLRAAGDRWVIAVSHHPLITSEAAGPLLDALDAAPRVVAAIWGHTHKNEIEPRSTASGGYWLISTGSLIDYPQQSRALRLIATKDGGVALQTWMVDHDPSSPLAQISRDLAFLDAQGGRPQDFIGRAKDRNVTLYKAAPATA